MPKKHVAVDPAAAARFVDGTPTDPAFIVRRATSQKSKAAATREASHRQRLVKKEDLENIHVRLPIGLMTRVRMRAVTERLSLSQVLESALEAWIKAGK
jgi:hypothetical protein